MFGRNRYGQIRGPRVYLAKSANGLRRHLNPSVSLNVHPIRLAAEKRLERGSTFHFVSDDGSSCGRTCC
jgi:hypothetical protein